MSPKLWAKNDGPDSESISDSILAGGVLYTLCSIASTNAEQSQQATHNFPDPSIRGHQFHLKRILVRQVARTIDRVLKAVRGHDVSMQQSAYTCNAYGAAAILHFEIVFFLKYFHQDHPFATGLNTHFVNWLKVVDEELIERIREGCRRFPNWRSGIGGSMKAFHQRHRLKDGQAMEGLTVSMCLRHITPVNQNIKGVQDGPTNEPVPPLGLDPHPPTTFQGSQSLSPETPGHIEDFPEYPDMPFHSGYLADPFSLDWFSSPPGLAGIEFDSAGKMPYYSAPMSYDHGYQSLGEEVFLDPQVLQNNSHHLAGRRVL